MFFLLSHTYSDLGNVVQQDSETQNVTGTQEQLHIQGRHNDIFIRSNTGGGTVLLICRSGDESTRSVDNANEQHEVQDNTNRHNNNNMNNVKRHQTVWRACGTCKYVHLNREWQDLQEHKWIHDLSY